MSDGYPRKTAAANLARRRIGTEKLVNQLMPRLGEVPPALFAAMATMVLEEFCRRWLPGVPVQTVRELIETVEGELRRPADGE